MSCFQNFKKKKRENLKETSSWDRVDGIKLPLPAALLPQQHNRRLLEALA